MSTGKEGPAQDEGREFMNAVLGEVNDAITSLRRAGELSHGRAQKLGKQGFTGSAFVWGYCLGTLNASRASLESIQETLLTGVDPGPGGGTA